LGAIKIGMLLIELIPGATLSEKCVDLCGGEFRCALIYYEFVVVVVVEDHEYLLAAQS
jgi:hypothetical protein